jgi:penicillin amidase
VQYRGDLAEEWASYGPDTRAIVTAFTRGVNAWITHALEQLPQEFALAGWKPEPWQPEDLLNRTDAFVAGADAMDEVFRAQLTAAVGAARTDLLFPPRDGQRTSAANGVDLGAVNPALADVLRRIGAPPVFSGLAAPLGESDAPQDYLRPSPGSNAWAVSRSTSPDRSPLVAGDPHRPLTVPSLRYLVHLKAPGWNVMGATAPWMPGVAIGHNTDIAWSMTSSRADVQDLYVEKLNPRNPRQVEYRGAWVDMEVERDAVVVKGRSEPFEYDRLYTRNGVVIGLDPDRELAYTLRWSGAEPGGAGELAALRIDRATTWSEFAAALQHWKMPVVEFVYGDRTGRIARQLAGLIPRRAAGAGHIPAAAAPGRADWRGWTPFAALPRTLDPGAGFLVSANGSAARENRLTDMITRLFVFDVDAAKRLQHDVGSWPAEQLIPLLQRLRSEDPRVDAARNELVTSDRRVGEDYVSALYVAWEHMLRRMLVERRVPPALRDEAVFRLADVVTPLVRPTRAWFDGEVARARDALLLQALAAAVETLGDRDSQAWSGAQRVTFTHPLGVGERARQRFNVGPVPVPGYANTVFAVTATTGPALQLIFDIADWDRSVGVNAPGQSGAPASPHYADLAKRWAEAGYIPLPFSDEAVQSSAAATLTLTPRK